MRRILIIAAVSVVLVLASEGAVRVFAPGINLQGTDRALLRENAWGASVGLAPGARGTSFGAPVTIDADGTRRITEEAPPDDADRPTWLVLGDSVAFGVGVAGPDTFAGRLDRACADVYVRNGAVIGHGLLNYRDVVRALPSPTPRRVLLCYCLNDVEGYFDRLPEPGGIVERTRFFLRRSSKLYMGLKAVFADRSRAYFAYDYGLYADPSPATASALDAIADIARAVKAAGAELDVFLFPYEVQLRDGVEDPFLPQRTVAARWRAAGVRVHDLAPAFVEAARTSAPADLYLTADAMHLSVAGHEIAFRAIERALEAVGSAAKGGRD